MRNIHLKCFQVLLFKEVMVHSTSSQYRSRNDKMMSSTIHLRKWGAEQMKSIRKTKSYVKKEGYF